MLSDILGAHAAGLRNILIITGAPPKMGPYPEATAVFDIDSLGLTMLVSRLNHGLDPGSNPIGAPTRWVIGVGVNPGALDLDRELSRFAWKVDAGAEFGHPAGVRRAAAGAVPRAGGAVQDSGGGGDLAALVAPQRRVPRERGPRGVRAGGGARAHAEGERPREGGGARRGRRDRARDVPASEGRRAGSAGERAVRAGGGGAGGVQVGRQVDRRLRLARTAFLALYGVVLALHPERYGWLDSLDVAIHEVGHPLFGVFGEFIGMLGGTLMQLLMPALFVAYFWRRGDRHAATVALWWVAQNLWNISVYIKDARAGELPLVGGGEHDWAYLPARRGLLDQDQLIGGAVQLLGVLLLLWSCLRGWTYSAAFVRSRYASNQTP